MTYQIISNFERGEKCRIEPQTYWCDVARDEEIMDSGLTLEEARKFLATYNK